MRRIVCVYFFIAVITSLAFTGSSFAAAQDGGSLEEFIGVWVAEDGKATSESGSLDHPLRDGNLSIKKAKKNDAADIFGRVVFSKEGDNNWSLGFVENNYEGRFPVSG